MPAKSKAASHKDQSSATIGFEAKLWLAADKLGIDFIGTIGLGDGENHSKDIPGRVYEYVLGCFASAEGRRDGGFYTPHCVDKLLVFKISPYKERIYDCGNGSGGSETVGRPIPFQVRKRIFKKQSIQPL